MLAQRVIAHHAKATRPSGPAGPLALGLLLLVFEPSALATPNTIPCSGQGTSIVIRTDDKRLHLCEQGKSRQAFDVAIGWAGTPKRKQGDNKTPLGNYPLGRPRGSKRYHRFIPVGYPTPAQRRLGYSGSAIGIHGPPRWSTWAGSLNTALGWTRGCIAVGSDAEIDAIAAWIRVKRPRQVHLEAGPPPSAPHHE